eukprot:2941675-Pleurochrysis_carterae.AAC.3
MANINAVLVNSRKKVSLGHRERRRSSAKVHSPPFRSHQPHPVAGSMTTKALQAHTGPARSTAAASRQATWHATAARLANAGADSWPHARPARDYGAAYELRPYLWMPRPAKSTVSVARQTGDITNDLQLVTYQPWMSACVRYAAVALVTTTKIAAAWRPCSTNLRALSAHSCVCRAEFPAASAKTLSSVVRIKLTAPLSLCVWGGVRAKAVHVSERR